MAIGIRSVTEISTQRLSGKRSSFTLKAWIFVPSIGRFLNCSHVAGYNWIKAYGESIASIRSAAGVEVVELDEIHTYIGSKKTIAGSGWLLIEMANDSSTAKWVGTETGRKLWEAIEDQPITNVMSDYWRPYEQFVPKELHMQLKAETYTSEGYNSLFRHFLARLRRKSKCYSKSKMIMLKYSIMLLMFKWNGELDTILY